MKPMQINDAMKKLEAGMWDKKHRDIIDKLSQLVLLSEYDKAISLINDTMFYHWEQRVF